MELKGISDLGYEEMCDESIWYLEFRIGDKVKQVSDNLILVDDYEYEKKYLLISY